MLATNPLVVVVDPDATATADGRISVLVAGDGAAAVPSLAHDRPLQDALALMLERHSAWVAVTEQGRYRGLLGIDDFWNGTEGN